MVDAEAKATGIVSLLRMEAGRCPDNPDLAALVGELSLRSEEFRRLWAARHIQDKGHGSVRLQHPLVGELGLQFEALALSGSCDESLLAYYAEPGSSSVDALRLLASWGQDATTAVP